MTKLNDLYAEGGQSPWIDNLKRSYLTSGHLAELIGQGVRGLTSNPTIMAKAIEGGAEYDRQFEESMRRHNDVTAAYWDLVVTDVVDALELFSALYEESDRGDGFVSIEVAPGLARDTAGTISAARELHKRVGRPNVLVKIPATAEGLPAIRQMIGEGRSINVTLIFSIERYKEVIEAYQSGLEDLVAAGGEPASVASVASFFVSRVDTETDRRLEASAALGTRPQHADKALGLRGKTAVAQARVAYETFEQLFSGPRWEQLAKGVRGHSGHFGHRPPRRTPHIRTSLTWTASWHRTRSTPCPRRRWRACSITARCLSWEGPSLRMPSASFASSPRSGSIWRMWPASSRRRGWPPSQSHLTASSRS